MPVAVDKTSTQAAMMLMRPLMPFPPDLRLCSRNCDPNSSPPSFAPSGEGREGPSRNRALPSSPTFAASSRRPPEASEFRMENDRNYPPLNRDVYARLLGQN